MQYYVHLQVHIIIFMNIIFLILHITAAAHSFFILCLKHIMYCTLVQLMTL